MNRWLITGGCGFIGVNLIKHLLQNKLAKSIKVIDNLSTSNEKLFNNFFYNFRISTNKVDTLNESDIQLTIEDIKNFDSAIELTKNVDIVVHLAANTGVQLSIANPLIDMQNNIIGTLNYLEASRINNVKSFIFASSGAPIGKAIPPIHEELACKPISPYGASKLAGEAYCSAYQKSYGLNTSVLRFSNVYGPFSSFKSSVVAKFIRQALNKETWVLNGGGGQTRDFIYVSDLIDALVLVALHNQPSSIYQLATNEETTIIQLATKLAPLMIKKFNITPNIEIGKKLLGDVMRNFSDISKIKNEIGWVPKISLDQGLELTCDWFKSL